jgi:3-oxoacyl-[acyl-carrier protein] reductase
MTETDWDTVLGVHLTGSFLMTRAVQKHMVNAKFGRIVNISSTASSTAALGKSRSGQLLRGQAGLQGFTRALVIELGPFGISANSLAPASSLPR